MKGSQNLVICWVCTRSRRRRMPCRLRRARRRRSRRHPGRGDKVVASPGAAAGAAGAAGGGVRFDVDALLAPSRPQATSSSRPLPLGRAGIAALAKKVLHRTEAPETSLLTAVLRFAADAPSSSAGAAPATGRGGAGERRRRPPLLPLPTSAGSGPAWRWPSSPAGEGFYGFGKA
jgi:hypothetical protein